MTSNKDKSSLVDSGELFKTLFREKLEDFNESKPKNVATGTEANRQSVPGKKASVHRKGKNIPETKPKTPAKKERFLRGKTSSPVKEKKRSGRLRPILYIPLLGGLLVFNLIYHGILDFNRYKTLSRSKKERLIANYILEHRAEGTIAEEKKAGSPQTQGPQAESHTSIKENISKPRGNIIAGQSELPKANQIHEPSDEAISEDQSHIVKELVEVAVPLQGAEPPDNTVASAKERILSYPYSIYLGSYRTIERLQRAVTKYRKKGLSPYWVQIDLGEKGVWFRVFTGHFQKREDADAHIKEEGIDDAKSRRTKYANLIGVYTSEEELSAIRLELLKLGYSTYVIDGINDSSRLYTGAFYQMRRAEKHHAELASKGIQGRIVER